MQRATGRGKIGYQKGIEKSTNEKKTGTGPSFFLKGRALQDVHRLHRPGPTGHTRGQGDKGGKSQCKAMRTTKTHDTGEVNLDLKLSKGRLSG